MGWFRRISTSRPALRVLYYIWVAFPYPVRKPLTAAGIFWVLAMKKVAGVNGQNKPTPMKDLGNLSFWGYQRSTSITTPSSWRARSIGRYACP